MIPEGKLHILIADCDRDGRAATEAMLREISPNATVIQADTCAGALDAVQRLHFDCVFISCRFDDGNAIVLLRSIREAKIDTPVIILSTNGDELIAAKLMKLGASDYLPKASLTRESLDKSLAEALAAYREAVRNREEAAAARRRADNHVRILSEASVILGSSLDYEATLASIANLAVPFFADLCIVDMYEGGKVRRTAIANSDPATDAFATVLKRYPPDPAGSHPVAKALRTGRPAYSVDSFPEGVSASERSPLGVGGRSARWDSFLPPLAGGSRGVSDLGYPSPQVSSAFVDAPADDSLMVRIAQDDVHMTALRALHFHSYIVMPLVARGRTLGAVSFIATSPDRTYNDTDIMVAEELARRAAVAVDNACLFAAGERERQLLEASEERYRFLAQVDTVLASSLDYSATLSSVARMAVAYMADWCAVDIVAGDTLRRVAVAHVDEAKLEYAAELARRYPVNMNGKHGVPAVIRSGMAEMVSEITPEMVRAGSIDDEQVDIVLKLGLRSYICVPLHASGRTYGAITLIAAESGRQYGESDLALAQELGYRASLAVENARLFNEARARAEREQFINEVGKKMRASLDAAEIVRIATTEVGRALGASRVVWMRFDRDSGAFYGMPEQYCKPGVLPLLRSYRLDRYPASLVEALQAGETVVSSDLSADSRFADHYQRENRRADTIGFLASPVFLGGELGGYIAMHELDGPRDWSTTEADALTAISGSLALALENARAYAREHRVAEMLQSAFLSNVPRQLPGLTIASLYRAGLEESQVGGDFYDAFLLPDGRVALVMADVSGKGLGAAVQTATVKFSLRAFANEAAAPGLVLTRVNKMLLSDSMGLGDHFVTLFYAVFDPASGRLTYASAGHETQTIKRREGGVTLLPATGPVINVMEHRYEQSVECLGPGDSVVLFTDGLTEARSRSRELLDIKRVIAAIDRAPAEAGASALVLRMGRLAMHWANNRPQDDLALLVARNDAGGNDPGGDEAPTDFGAWEGDGQDPLFEFNFASRPDYAAEVRQAVAHWMAILGFGRVAIEDFQTAVTEAVTNAVRHGSPQGGDDEFIVRGFRGPEDALIVEVGDRGPGLTGSTEQSAVMPDPTQSGGRGLPLIYVFADDVDYVPSATEHWVRLMKRHHPSCEP